MKLEALAPAQGQVPKDPESPAARYVSSTQLWQEVETFGGRSQDGDYGTGLGG